MSWEELVGELRKLSRVEKLGHAQILSQTLLLTKMPCWIDSTSMKFGHHMTRQMQQRRS
ncbi:MAG: hypothetical protein U0694_18880 [Anaerolineae bacterium]